MRYENGTHTIYVNAEVDDGSEAARMMRYFKTADPEDMSQGELSERVRYLKSEKGEPEMCRVSEWIYDQGKIAGEAQGKAEGKIEGALAEKCATAERLRGQGWPEAEIAVIVNVGIDQVREWVGTAASA